MKKCVFYLPYKLDEHGMGARMLRPRKMIQAFKKIGYDVFVIEGTASERKDKILTFKRQCKNGDKFDFMYTESHTIPTLLTDPSHLPSHPFMDFGFFRFVKKHGIKIGLFYPDIYWKFDDYGKGLSKIKKAFALFNYRYDIFQYKKQLSKFYVPDLKVCRYIHEPALSRIASELSPGADNIQIPPFERKPSNEVSVFYVGGIGSQYQILELVKAVYQTKEARLTICCREKEWENEKAIFLPYMCDRIHIVHKNNDELEPFYQKADLCSLLFKKDIYREMAKPFKAYEYLAHEIPVLSTKGTAIGNFVEENDIGWNIEFTAEEIKRVLKMIAKNPEVLHDKRINCSITKKKNLWTTRAEQVARDLY